MTSKELGGFQGVLGATETKGSHELYEGRKGCHGGRRTRGRSDKRSDKEKRKPVGDNLEQ